MIRFLLGSAAVLLSAQVASAAVLTFTTDATDYTPFDDTLGDIAGLDVTNTSRAGFGNTAENVTPALLSWGVGYSNLLDVAFAAANGLVGELAFAPSAGQSVTITSFLLGSYSGGPLRSATMYIYDAGWNVLWSSIDYQISGDADLISPNITSTGPLYFQFGTDWNLGIDDFTYSVSRTDPDPDPDPVPLPAALPLLGLGLAGLAALRRRKRG